MRYLRHILLALGISALSFTALAEGDGPVPPDSSASAGAVANSGALAKSQSQSESMALAKGGEASAVGEGGAASANNGGVSVITKVPRDAPPVGGAGGNPGGDDPANRADDCMVGKFIGGTNDSGGISIGPVTMQGECYALVMYQWYSDKGMPEQASVAFCSARKHRAHYGNMFDRKRKEKCEAAIYQMLIVADLEVSEELGKPMTPSRPKGSG